MTNDMLVSRDLLESLVDDDDCTFDHHGGCQAHGYLSLGPGEQCPQGELKRLLADPRPPQYVRLTDQHNPAENGWYDTRTHPWTRVSDPKEGWTRLVLPDGGLLDMPPADPVTGNVAVITMTDERFGDLMRAAVDMAATGEVYTADGQHVPRSNITGKD